MTTHEPEPGAGLTDTEREVLREWWDNETGTSRSGSMLARLDVAVERIVSARTADLRAERDRRAAQVAAAEAVLKRWNDGVLAGLPYSKRLLRQFHNDVTDAFTQGAAHEPGPPTELWDRRRYCHACFAVWPCPTALATGAAEGGDERG